MIQVHNKDYAKLVADAVNEKYDFNITPRQCELIITFCTKKIIKEMFLTNDIKIERFFKLSYNKKKVALYHRYKKSYDAKQQLKAKKLL